MSYIKKLVRIKTKLNEYFEKGTHNLRFVQLPSLKYDLSIEDGKETVNVVVPIIKFGKQNELNMTFEDNLEGPWESNLHMMLERFYKYPAPLIGSVFMNPNMTYGEEFNKILSDVSEYFVSKKIAIDFSVDIAEQTSEDFFAVRIEVTDAWHVHELIYEETLHVPVKNSDAFFKSLEKSLTDMIDDVIQEEIEKGRVFSWMEVNEDVEDSESAE